VANARKALTGQYHGLLNPIIMHQKEDDENALIKAADIKKGGPWSRIGQVQTDLQPFERDYFLLERGDAFDSRLFRIARHLVRLADELPKDDGKRLAEYRSSALESLKFQLFSPAAIAEDLERVKLAGSLAFLAENVGGED